ncbi:MAG: hypothetical protein QGG73_00080 [Candidatus Hydrogenedentes bacterium]|jgi:hypothetical protein|nr:hypothetical protein [Candidatus Hydrogenedentota bacterium]
MAGKQLSGGANTDVTYYHPFFGEFDCTQWAAFNILHADIHVQQMQRVKRSEGFPR